MTSSYIGPPRPMLLGDAERAVAAVITAGWIPGTVTPEQTKTAATAIDERLSRHTGALSGNQALGAAHVAARAFGLTVAEPATPSRE
jgi:hypothetical protein